MEKKKKRTNISIAGEINQTINKNNRRFIKMTTASCYIELPPDMIPDVHLGDAIVIDGCIQIRSIDPGFNPKRPTILPDEICANEPED